jgi:hypothetical protein
MVGDAIRRAPMARSGGLLVGGTSAQLAITADDYTSSFKQVATARPS